MRFMCNKKLIDKVPIVELLKLTDLTPIDKLIKMKKLKWFGHIKRSKLPVKVVVEGLFDGKRKPGRPRRRWYDDVKEWTDLPTRILNKRSQDRALWKQVVVGITFI